MYRKSFCYYSKSKTRLILLFFHKFLLSSSCDGLPHSVYAYIIHVTCIHVAHTSTDKRYYQFNFTLLPRIVFKCDNFQHRCFTSNTHTLLNEKPQRQCYKANNIIQFLLTLVSTKNFFGEYISLFPTKKNVYKVS